jgi:hypothetical protein
MPELEMVLVLGRYQELHEKVLMVALGGLYLVDPLMMLGLRLLLLLSVGHLNWRQEVGVVQRPWALGRLAPRLRLPSLLQAGHYYELRYYIN